MIDDLRTFASGTVISADICLIGGGAAGITLAQEFAGGSVKVCVVEGGGLEYESDSQDLYAGENVGAPILLEGGRLRFLGGSTNHWGGRCAPLDGIDFRKRSWIPHSGWPIDKTELDPYYARAQRICGFERPWLSDVDTLAYLKTRLPPVNQDLLQTYLWRYAPSTRETGIWNWAIAYRQVLETARNIQVLLHANFSAISTTEDRTRVRSITVRSLNGIAATIHAKKFVICAGGIENPRLLLLGAEQNGGGFGNAHDAVGRYFIQHSGGTAGLISSEQRLSRLQEQYNILTGADGHEIEVGLALSPGEQRRLEVLNCSAYLTYVGDPESGISAAQDIWRSLKTGRWPSQMGEKVGRMVADAPEVLQSVVQRLSVGHTLTLERSTGVPSRSAVISLWVEQSPDPDSRVSLSTERDALGLRRVKVDWRIGELERRSAAAITKAVGAEFARLEIGRGRLEPWVLDNTAPLADSLKETFHYTGATRMSDDPREGVVDRHCAVHGMLNLFVAGSSVFPTAGHANPTFTIVALALRLADHLKS